MGQHRQNWESASREGAQVGSAVDRALAYARSLAAPDIPDELAFLLTESNGDPAQPDLAKRRSRVLEHLQSARDELKTWMNDVATTVEALKRRESTIQIEVERALAKLGLESSKLVEFQKLNRQAALLTSYEANLRETSDTGPNGRKILYGFAKPTSKLGAKTERGIRSGSGVCSLRNSGKEFARGGLTMEIFDPSTNSWPDWLSEG